MKIKNSVLLVGSSQMAIDYSEVLKSLNTEFVVVGRGNKSAKLFFEKTGTKVFVGGITKYLYSNKAPKTAIVSVSIDQLVNVTTKLIIAGTKRILLEKPGGLEVKELSRLNAMAKRKKVKIFVAYNRRFYSSVIKLKKLIKKDNGILSVKFDFTEWSHKIKLLKKKSKIKKKWLYANSSHVIDLVFYLCGKPKVWKNYHDGKNQLDWHPSSARFCGSGITNDGVMFSYISDWLSSGRWGIEIMTKKNRYILKPLEKLKVIRKGTIKEVDVKINDKNDIIFKPGLFLQTKNFLNNKDEKSMCTIHDQGMNLKLYKKIAGYK